MTILSVHPIVLLLVWFESLVSWNGPIAIHQVELSLVSWLSLGNIKAPKHRFRYPSTKWKICRFVIVAVTPSFLNRVWWVFYILEKHNVYRRPKYGSIRVRFLLGHLVHLQLRNGYHFFSFYRWDGQMDMIDCGFKKISTTEGIKLKNSQVIMWTIYSQSLPFWQSYNPFYTQ